MGMAAQFVTAEMIAHVALVVCVRSYDSLLKAYKAVHKLEH